MKNLRIYKTPFKKKKRKFIFNRAHHWRIYVHIDWIMVNNTYQIFVIFFNFYFSVSIVAIHASFIDEMHVYTASNPNEKDEENHEHFSEEHAIFDTQIINKESYGLEVLTDPEKPTGLI
jgi:hypothetical protein